MGDPMLESTLTLCQSRLYPQSGTSDLASAYRGGGGGGGWVGTETDFDDSKKLDTLCLLVLKNVPPTQASGHAHMLHSSLSRGTE